MRLHTQEVDKMATDTTVRARLDRETKTRATAVLRSIGLNPSDLIRITFRKVAAEGHLPFVIDAPSDSTQAALDELDRSEGHRFATVDALMTDLDD
jgi:DNA-damage-inducible protein J